MKLGKTIQVRNIKKKKKKKKNTHFKHISHEKQP